MSLQMPFRLQKDGPTANGQPLNINYVISKECSEGSWAVTCDGPALQGRTEVAGFVEVSRSFFIIHKVLMQSVRHFPNLFSCMRTDSVS